MNDIGMKICKNCGKEHDGTFGKGYFCCLHCCKSFAGKYAFLSNFHDSVLIYEGIKYPTVEHAFQAMKTFDIAQRKEIANLRTPGEAKRAGRRVSLRADWEDVKDNIMYEILCEKFKNSELRQMLLETGDEFLEEGTTWHDNYWGNCYCPKCKDIVGKNMLGKTLMRVRDEIRNA